MSHDFRAESETAAQTVSRCANGVIASMSEVRQISAPVLLARPGYGGTIAAIRDLARDDISVSVLTESLLEAGRWSKHVRATISTGPQSDPRALLATLGRLIEVGTGPVPPVLLPTCDSTAWTYAAYADELSPHFCIYAPPIETMARILDKGQFERACADAGVPVLKSWMVPNESVLGQIADTLLFPLIIKPRTHVRRRLNDKGDVVANYDQLVRTIQRVQRSDAFFDAEGDHPHPRDLFLQQFVDVFPKGVLSVSGFMDRSGKHFEARASRKILLRSEPAGVGVCFESTPLDPMLAEQTACLCRNLHYFGVFEVEFIWDGARWAAIDFNPRFYNQMALDIMRGLPLARLCYYDAIGDSNRVASLIQQAQATSADDNLCVRDGLTMHLILLFRSLSGLMSRRNRLEWYHWCRNNRAAMRDMILAWDDPLIWPVHIISEVRLGLRKLFKLAKFRWTERGQTHA